MVALTYISLVTKDVEYLFIYFLAIAISSFAKIFESSFLQNWSYIFNMSESDVWKVVDYMCLRQYFSVACLIQYPFSETDKLKSHMTA